MHDMNGRTKLTIVSRRCMGHHPAVTNYTQISSLNSLTINTSLYNARHSVALGIFIALSLRSVTVRQQLS